MRYLQYILHILQIHITASYIFKVPPFLNCEGPTFDPIWSVFRESAVANAQAGYPRNESLREMAVELISAFEPSMILGARAWVVQLRSAATGDTYHLRQAELNAADDVAFTLSTNIGLKENLGRAAAAQRSVQKDESDPTGFCLYGYVQALFIEFRHTVPLQEQGTAALQNDPRLATCHDRRPLLDVAEQLLGGETCETDFLESSDWPVRRLDVYVRFMMNDERLQVLLFKPSKSLAETLSLACCLVRWRTLWNFKKKGSVKLHPQCVPPVHHAHFLHGGARCGGTTLISTMSEMCMMDNAEAVVLDDAHGPKTVNGRYFVSGAIHSLLLSGRCTTVL